MGVIAVYFTLHIHKTWTVYSIAVYSMSALRGPQVMKSII